MNKQNKILNKKFGKLTPLYKISKTLDYKEYWLFLCECGNKKSIRTDHVTSNRITSCGCRRREGAEKHPSWKGHKGLSGTLWATLLARAKKKQLKVSITKKYIWKLFLKQNGKCALSAVDICLPSSRSRKWTASIDRINNSKGYIYGNVQWVHKDVNIMKNCFTQRYFLKLCRKIIKNRNKYAKHETI